MAAPSARSTVRRLPERARYDAATVHGVLDEALVCHVAAVVDGRPLVLPTLHVRLGDTLYLHGSSAAGLALAARTDRAEVCVAVTLLDGLVLARSAFHHSANYRSVVVHGAAHRVTDPGLVTAALHALVEKVAAGRAAGCRPPDRRELAATVVLAIPLTESSAKVRGGPPVDEDADLGLPHWAGVLPVRTRVGVGRPAPDLAPGVTAPPYAGAVDWFHPAPLEGEHVRLEALDRRHVDGLFAASGDDEVWRWLTSARPVDRAAMAELVDRALAARAADERVPWVQVDRATGRVAGTTSYYELDPVHGGLAIGHTWLGRPWWRTTLNTEAKLLLLTRAFEHLGARRVGWHTDALNLRSRRAIERLGAVREGVLRHHRVRPDGSLRDTAVHGMVAGDWPAARDRLRTALDRRG